MMRNMKEYCIVSDGSGHKYICPLELQEEVEKNLEELESFWDSCDYDSKEEPEDLVDKYSLPMIGGDLTFTNPKIDGVSI